MAKKLEHMGAHILAIKDMAGLCKPAAAERLIRALKQEVGIPIHFHTHDTAGVQAASILDGSKVKLDIADAAMAPLSGGTSQVNLNTLAESLRYGDRDPQLPVEALDGISEYWRAVRGFILRLKVFLWPQQPICIGMKCLVGSTRICSSRLGHWGWRTAGLRSVGCMPR